MKINQETVMTSTRKRRRSRRKKAVGRHRSIELTKAGVFVIQNLNLIPRMTIGPSPVLPPLQLVGKTIEFHLPIILWQIFSFLVLFILFQIHL